MRSRSCTRRTISLVAVAIATCKPRNRT